MFKIAESFGQYLRGLRKKRGFTLKELGKEVGLSYSYLSQLERGERGTKGVPSIEVLKKISKPLGVHTLELMHEAGLITEEGEEEYSRDFEILADLKDWLNNVQNNLILNGKFIQQAEEILASALKIHGINDLSSEEFFKRAVSVSEQLLDRSIKYENSSDVIAENKPIITVMEILDTLARHINVLWDLSIINDQGQHLFGLEAISYLKDKDEIIAKENDERRKIYAQKRYEEFKRDKHSYIDIHYLLEHGEKTYYKKVMINDRQRQLILAYLDALIPEANEPSN